MHKHGETARPVPVSMCAGRSQRGDSPIFLNAKDDGPDSPGPSAAAITFPVNERNVNGRGAEAAGADYGRASAIPKRDKRHVADDAEHHEHGEQEPLAVNQHVLNL